MRWPDSLWVRPYEAGDEGRFTPRPDMAEERAAVAWDWSSGPPGPTWTLQRATGEIVGFGGFVDRGDGAVEAWASLAVLTLQDWPRIVWLAARRLEGVRLTGAGRIFAACRAGRPGAALVLRRLGFAFAGAISDPRLPGVPIHSFQRTA